MARAGRKRKQDVERYSSQRVRQSYQAPEKPLEGERAIQVLKRFEGEKHVGFMVQADPIERLGLTKAQKVAADQFRALCNRCRRYAWDSPGYDPMVSRYVRGHGRRMSPDFSEEGERHHKAYLEAVDAVSKSGKGRVRLLVLVCLENKMPTEVEAFDFKQALQALVRHWKL